MEAKLLWEPRLKYNDQNLADYLGVGEEDLGIRRNQEWNHSPCEENMELKWNQNLHENKIKGQHMYSEELEMEQIRKQQYDRAI